LRRKREKTKPVRTPGARASRLRAVGQWAVLAAVVAALLFVLVINLRQRFKPSGPYRVDYEGRIVDKSITLEETSMGSGSVKRLHIRGKDGETFDVIVNRSLYDRAQVGMWIRSDRNGAKLSWDEPPPASAATKTEGAEPPSISAPR
jgi:hypothetical protein